MPPKNKKGGKGGKSDDWDDAAAEKKLAALAIEKEDSGDAFSDDEPAPPPKPKNKMAAFAMLDDSEEESSKAPKSDSEPETKSEAVEKAEPKKDKKKAKKGKKDKGNKEDDELDAILESLDKPMEKTEKVEKSKNQKKKEKKERELAAAEEENLEEGEAKGDEPPKEKPEGDDAADDDGKKKKKKKKKGKKEEKEETPEGEEGAEKTEKEEKEDKEGDDDQEKAEGDEDEEGKKKKKKDKKKKGEEKKDGKKKKHVDMIKEMLRAKQEAEEAEQKRIKEEQERLEALEKAREEQERIAREEKERQKKEKKEREEQLKKEGKFETAKQREKRERALAQLAAANITIEKKEGEPPKRPVYGKQRYRPKKEAQKKGTEEKETSEPRSESPVVVEMPKAEEEKSESPTEQPEATAAVDDEPLDDWEMAEEVEKEETPAKAEKAKPAAAPVATAAATTAAKPAVETKKAPTPAPAVSKQSSKDEEEEESESSSDEDCESDESSDESSSEESSSDEETTGKGKETKEQVAERVRMRLKKRREAAEAKKSVDNLRAPVICVLGHVDTGKTKMLDTIRRTNVQDGEAGGITQQIGATQVPAEAIKERCKMVRNFVPDQVRLPGFLIIDTPGHESFANLRSRGNSLCDFAILVVDIMHGLEPQTKESLKLLRQRGTPFVVALNKIDRLYGYESNPRKDVYQLLKSQPQNTQLEFKERYEKIVVEFAEESLNVTLSNQNKDEEEYISMVPTSAYLGDGIGNLMEYIVNTTQRRYAQKLAFCEELDATVMEVKAIPGLGTTIDVILVNGTLNAGDIIILTGTEGAIMTQIRELLMPQPLRELRVKNEYGHYKQVKGAQGVKILAKGLEKALAGLPLFVAHKDDEVDILREDADAQLSKALMAIKRKPEGVYVQASTLGSLEALLEFLRTQKIPYSNVNIGPVHKKDVQKAAAMLEHNAEYACILAFDVRVERDAQQFADNEGVRIFQADIIYHLEDNFLKYREELRLKARREHEHLAVFPCRLRVLPQHIFNARNPIVIGVTIEAGQIKKGTPICVPSKECIFLGNVSSIEKNHDQVDSAKQGDEVCIKIENTTGEAPKMYGRHFTHEDALVSRITRESIDVCKTYFRDDLTKADWQVIVQLKKVLDIM